MTPGQPYTIWDDLAKVIAADPLLSDVPTRIEWLRKRHRPTKRILREWKMLKASEVAAA